MGIVGIHGRLPTKAIKPGFSGTRANARGDHH